MAIEFVDELPPVDTANHRGTRSTQVIDQDAWEPKRSTGVFRMVDGDDIECDCGASTVRREGDVYHVDGSFYHSNDSGYQDWLICSKCDDHVKISSMIVFTDVNSKAGIA